MVVGGCFFLADDDTLGKFEESQGKGKKDEERKAKETKGTKMKR